MPKVPPRPINRRLERAASPERDRFAPSPLNESPLVSKSPKPSRSSPTNGNGFGHGHEPPARPPSVSMPTVGEEGMEYAALDTATAATDEQNTHTVGDDVKLFAPKPSLPALSAKQRVQAVTRTDSDRAAQFGIGKPSSDETVGGKGASSLKKKGSTTSGISESDSHFDEEHGIPEIGQRVPMLAYAGDVQAPSPAPSASSAAGVSGITEGLKSAANHRRKHSARGLADPPPGSYGLHGHGKHVPQDKLDKAYYEKHPEAIERENCVSLHERVHDFSMSHEDLNKIVNETAVTGKGLGESYRCRLYPAGTRVRKDLRENQPIS